MIATSKNGNLGLVERPTSRPSSPSMAFPLADMVQLMAFDFGSQRTGVAVGNRITQTATALPTVVGKGDLKWRGLDRLVREWEPHALVVGVPFHPDGAAHANTRRARGFGHSLRDRYGLKVYEVDERYTTTEAHLQGAFDADGVAACLILEQFLRGLMDGR